MLLSKVRNLKLHYQIKFLYQHIFIYLFIFAQKEHKHYLAFLNGPKFYHIT